MSDDREDSQQRNLSFDRDAFVEACHIFAPLKELWLKLSCIQESENSRDDLDEIIKALIPFIGSIHIEHRDGRLNDLPLRRITDLMHALHDLNEGKAPALLQPDESKKAQNRNTKTGEQPCSKSSV